MFLLNLTFTDVNNDSEVDPRFADKEIPRSRLKIEDKLGSGKFGIVYKGFALGFGEKGKEEYTPVAVKGLKRKFENYDICAILFHFIHEQIKLEHPNLIGQQNSSLSACSWRAWKAYCGRTPLYSVSISKSQRTCLAPINEVQQLICNISFQHSVPGRLVMKMVSMITLLLIHHCIS